jgi:hypothetical protein
MPNWCSNRFELVGPKEKIREFEAFLGEGKGKNWFDFFLPCPEELKNTEAAFGESVNQELIEKYGASDWYSWSIENWGCKWNCDAQSWNVEDYDEHNLSISFWFDSPWGPPIALYEFIEQDESLSVFGHYLEEGMCFVGKYEYGTDSTYEYSDLDSLDSIPDDVLEEWNLRESIEEREMMDEDEDFDDENEEETK